MNLRFAAWFLTIALAVAALAGCSQQDGVAAVDFDKILKDNAVVLVDFKADWCGPCKTMAPVVHELEKEYQGKVKVVTVDVDASQELAVRYHITAIPCFKVFKGGSEVASIVGGVPRSELESAIKTALGS